MPAATDTGVLSYAQLKGVWMDASKGTRYHSNVWASLMAAIAEAESGGKVLVTNPNDNGGTQTSWGLWQISNGTHTAPSPNWGDPSVNAKLAIGKLDSQGLKAWGTYNSGAYKAFLSGKTAPDFTLTGAPSAVDQAQVTASAEGQKSCAWSVGWGGIPDTSFLSGLFGSSGNLGSGEVCLLSKSQARALIGVGMVWAGGVLMLVGVNWMLIAAAAPKLTQFAGAFVGAAAPEVATAGKAGSTLGKRARPGRP
jgi:hypothetical protein